MTNFEPGRQALEAFAEALDRNAYEEDLHFRHLVGRYAPEDRREALDRDLNRFGAQVLRDVDRLVRKNNEPHNLPRLDRWTDYGRRQEKVDHHPTYHQAGAYIYGSGMMSAYGDHPNSLGALTRFYLSSLNGEAGHNCPAACTAGVIRVLQELGTEELKERYLPGFLSADYDTHLEGAQFLTELQGGSDVGANQTRAERGDDGHYRIYGEKWFCSNIDADVFLMTARVDDLDTPGTRGLGLFLVPRQVESGEVNRFFVRRLKDKLGTRTMASGEADFDGALAYHMGDVGAGFKNMMELVINTSRLYNAMGCCAVIRRAFLVGAAYAQHREAFGRPIGDYPLVQETLANLRAEQEALTSGNLYLVAMQDRLDRGETTDQERLFLRMAINLNKVKTAQSGRWACVEGIEILGGNGAIESFSVLPRLLRDSIVYENWEGTHNTLFMQVLRDMKRYEVHEAYFGHLQGLLNEAAGSPAEAGRAGELQEFLAAVRGRVEEMLEQPTPVASLTMREIFDDLVYGFYGAVRVVERATFGPGPAATDEDSLEHFFDLRLRGGPQRTDPDYLRRLSGLSKA